MVTRRNFIAGAGAATALCTPAILHAAEPYQVPEQFLPQIVRVKKEYEPGQILVVPQTHFLYLITEPRTAIRYGVGVGRAGLSFSGTATIQRKAEWPSWRPTDEMIAREPHKYERFAEGVPGGPRNPLGARAMYLYQNGRDTYYRIHGTTEPQSIGRSVSNGCIRMINAHVVDLYNRVELGTKVTVFG